MTRAAATACKNAVVLFHSTDLRLHDHEPFVTAWNHATSTGGRVFPLFVFDPRFLSAKSRLAGLPKSGVRRAVFLTESVADLRKRLGGALRCPLYVRVGKPEDLLPKFAKQVGAGSVFAYREVADEEVQIEAAWKAALEKAEEPVEVRLFWGGTMMHVDDIPRGPLNLTGVFFHFRKQLVQNWKVRDIAELDGNKLKPAPEEKPAEGEGAAVEAGDLPDLAALGYKEAAPKHDDRTVLRFTGGEAAGLKRLQDYLWGDGRPVSTYSMTRDGLLGANYSSKLSPWLAHGCLSPRLVYHELRRYEQKHGRDDATSTFESELLWRDFFRIMTLRWGKRLFAVNGYRRVPGLTWRTDKEAFKRWCEGRTGYPFVDANMRELRATGWMSNRGRQVVASFLAKDLALDWRLGAEHFEAHLLDYDVFSNWGNWAYVAGVGADSRPGRYFSVERQAQKHDPKGDYVRRWVPELAKLPTKGKSIFDPFAVLGRDKLRKEFRITAEVYPDPIPRSFANTRKAREKLERSAEDAPPKKRARKAKEESDESSD